MNIQTVKLAEIKPYWRNPRKHTASLEAVTESIRRYGFNVPLVLDEDFTIITGHTRYQALLALGQTEAPCVIVNLTKAQAKQYRLADNATSGLSEWDMTKLIPELRDVEGLADMKLFFPDIDADAMFKAAAAATEDTIQAHAEILDNTFRARSAEAQDRQVGVTCPECGAEFSVDSADIAKRGK